MDWRSGLAFDFKEHHSLIVRCTCSAVKIHRIRFLKKKCTVRVQRWVSSSPLPRCLVCSVWCPCVGRRPSACSVCVQVAGTMVTPTLIINMLSTCSHRQPITGQQPGQSRRWLAERAMTPVVRLRHGVTTVIAELSGNHPVRDTATSHTRAAHQHSRRFRNNGEGLQELLH